jgi:hypothetical protein
VIPLLFSAAWAADPADPAAGDYRSYLDQAKFFLRKGWNEDARDQLELAVATEDGRLDPEAWMLLAKVSYDRFDLGRARTAADRALVQSRTPEQATQARELLEYFDAHFGVVTIRGAQDGATSRLHLQSTSLQLDPDLAAWIEQVTLRVTEPVVLPYILGLPGGDYVIDGEPFTVTPGEATEVALRTQRPDLRSLAFEVAGAGYLTLGGRAAPLLPAPTAALGVSVPVGPLDVGLRATIGFQPFRTPTDPLNVGLGVGGAAHLGWVLPETGPFFVRPALVGAVGTIPGFGLPCTEQADGTFLCDREAAVQQLFVIAPAATWGADAEVTALWQDRRRARSFGFGVQLAAGARAARLPPGGRVLVDQFRDWTVTEGDRGFTVGVARMAVVARVGL